MRNARTTSAVCDPLEPRQLLAGNVTTSLINGDLLISGDADRNRILVSGNDMPPGTILIQSADDTTTVNGEFQTVVENVTGSVTIRLGAKPDQLVVRDLNLQSLRNTLRIDGGRHGDNILVQNSRINGALTIDGQHGDDTVILLEDTLAGPTTIRGGAGNDLVNLESTFNGKFTARGGPGNDTFATDASTFNARKSIDGEQGDDRIVTGIEVRSLFATGKPLGWQAGFSDYPVGQEAAWELESGIRALPPDLGGNKGFLLSGNNHSDDLFMFLKRKLGAAQGLKKNTTYLARFEIVFGSNAPTGCAGIGGSAGDSVHLKAGASTIEPRPVVGAEGYRMNIDKGNQALTGRNASNVGTIANGEDCLAAGDDPKYRSVQKTHVHTARVKTDVQGNLWVIVGTDSGFEGTTSIYYQSISVRLIPV
jgi:hypothetical protein